MESVLKVRIQTKYEHDVEEVRGIIIYGNCCYYSVDNLILYKFYKSRKMKENFQNPNWSLWNFPYWFLDLYFSVWRDRNKSITIILSVH